MDFSNQKNKTIILRGKSKIKQIIIEGIVYVKCDSYLTTFYTTNDTITYSITLKQVELQIEQYGFFRINRNTLINLKYFDSYVINRNRYLITTTGVKLNVSRRKWIEFRKFIKTQNAANLEVDTICCKNNTDH